MGADDPRPPDRAWPFLAVAAATLIIAGVRARMDGVADPIVAALLAAGLIVLGAWIALEARKGK